MLGDSETDAAVIIDPVLQTVERDLPRLGELGLELRYAVETQAYRPFTDAGRCGATDTRTVVTEVSLVLRADALGDREKIASGME